MAIIYSYPETMQILLTDMLIGTSTIRVAGKKKNLTKNFTIETLGGFIHDNFPTQWGEITGILSNQVDLQEALDSKQSNITLTTIGTSGPSTFINSVLNIPNYTANIPTKTSDLINDGEDGIHPFITAEDIPPSASTLNDVLTNGNNSLLKANIGELGLWDLEGPAYSTLKTFDHNFTFEDYSGNTAISFEQGILNINKSNLIAGSFSTNLLTVSRGYNLPNAAGTIALTSDLTPYLLSTIAASTYYPIPTGTISQYIRGDGTFTTFPTIPTVGTWGALNYPTWTTGAPFVKMTAAGTFALDTSTYLTSAVTSVGATSPVTSSGGNTPVISTSMNTNKLIGRYSSGTGVMEEVALGTGLSLNSSGILNAAASSPTGYFGAFQDMLTQTLALANVGQPFLIRTVDESNQVSITANGSGQLTRITPANTGVYNIQWSGQFQNPNNSIHDVNVWFRKGLTSSSGPGTDVVGSNGVIALPARKSAAAGEQGHVVAGWNFVLTIASGEYVEFYWMSDSNQITLQAYSAGDPPPSTASLIVTVTQQAGIMAGTGITAINSLTAASQTLITGTSGLDFNITSTGTSHTFNLPTASATTRGALSSTDWSTFNGKQNALTNPITGTGTTNYLPKFTGASALGNSLISESTGLITFNSASILLDNNRFLKGKFVDGTVKDIIGIDVANEIVIGNVSAFHFTNIPNIYIDGTAVPTFNLSNSAGALGQLILESGATGNINIRGNGGTRLMILSQNGQMAVAKGNVSLLAQQTIYPYATTIKGQVIKGFTGQTANLQEWQDSIGTVLALVTATGKVGIGTTAPVTTAKVQIDSTTQGFLPPRMTTAQMNAIVSPAVGLTIYNTDLSTICFYTTAWQKVTSTAV